jgi:hypothetical protein
MSLKDKQVKDQVFRYKKSKNIFGIVMIWLWMVLIALELIFIKNKDWGNYSVMAAGLLFILMYGFGLIFQYAKIKNGVLTIYADFIPKHIPLNSGTEIRKSVGDYIVKTQTKSVQINPQSLNEDSKKRLREIFKIKD